MTKDEVVSKMKTLNPKKGSYIVFGAAPLAVFDIREVNDIDLLVTEEYYIELQQKGWKKIHKGPKDDPVIKDIFEAHPNWQFSPYNPTLKELLSRAVEYKGFYFASIEDVHKWKQTSGRTKDLTDLKLIEDYIASKS